MKAVLAIGVIASLLTIGCSNQNTSVNALRAEIVDLRTQNTTLQAQLRAETTEREQMEARLRAAEININTLFEGASAKPAVQWILWRSQKYYGNALMGRTPSPEPLDSLDTQTGCQQSAQAHVAKQPGAQAGAMSFTTPGPAQGVWLVQMTCLPQGVDPRAPRD